MKHFVLTFSVHNFIHAIYELDFEAVIHEKCRKRGEFVATKREIIPCTFYLCIISFSAFFHSLDAFLFIIFIYLYVFLIGVFVCRLIVVAQWQSACALSKQLWVQFPVGTEFF